MLMRTVSRAKTLRLLFRLGRFFLNSFSKSLPPVIGGQSSPQDKIPVPYAKARLNLTAVFR